MGSPQFQSHSSTKVGKEVNVLIFINEERSVPRYNFFTQFLLLLQFCKTSSLAKGLDVEYEPKTVHWRSQLEYSGQRHFKISMRQNVIISYMFPFHSRIISFTVIRRKNPILGGRFSHRWQEIWSSIKFPNTFRCCWFTVFPKMKQKQRTCSDFHVRSNFM